MPNDRTGYIHAHIGMFYKRNVKLIVLLFLSSDLKKVNPEQMSLVLQMSPRVTFLSLVMPEPRSLFLQE